MMSPLSTLLCVVALCVAISGSNEWWLPLIGPLIIEAFNFWARGTSGGVG